MKLIAAYARIRHLPDHIIFAMQPDDGESTGAPAFLTTRDGQMIRFAATYPLEIGAKHLQIPTRAGNRTWYGATATRRIPCDEIVELRCGDFVWRREPETDRAR